MEEDDRGADSRWPALESGDREKGHHSHQYIIEIEVAVEPDPLFHHWMTHISVFIHHKCAPVCHTHTHINNLKAQMDAQTLMTHKHACCPKAHTCG